MTHPLTDDQLRQVAAHMALQFARHGGDASDDDLRAAFAACDIYWRLVADEKVYDAILDAAMDLIAEATITVEWPYVDECDTAAADALMDRAIRSLDGTL